MSTGADWTPPARLGEYRLVRPLGRGGMGHVWLAHDELLDRAVAVKLIDAAEPRPEQRERFLLEARAAARLSHPNVLAIYRVGELGRMPYIVAELVRGESLDRLPRPQPWRRVAELGLDLARGLAAAHRTGVLHRDLKPSNAILTEEGVVKIVDFGLAKLLDAAPEARPGTNDLTAAKTSPAARADLPARLVPAAQPAALDAPDGAPQGAPQATPAPELAMATVTLAPPPDMAPADAAVGGAVTRAGTLLGTPYYMSPEAWRGEPQTRRSDLYSLGALLYELASGEPPFAGVPVASLAEAVTSRDAPSLAGRVPDVSPVLATLADRCLARHPDERPDSADEVREILEHLLAPGTPTTWRGDDGPYRGLQVHQSQHREVFFGRAAAAASVTERLRGASLVVIAGDSGVGKSSLARAGVLPRVDDGALDGERRFATAIVVPGARPLTALAGALAAHLDATPADLTAELAGPPAAAVRTLLARLGPKRGLCLLVDPLDDLVLRADAAEAASVARLLAELAATPGPLRVLATARGDFLSRLAALPGLAGELPRALLVLPPLDLAGLREAIEGPARAAGVSFEPPELVDELARAAASAPGGLPLLSFALAELWAARDVERRVIDRATVEEVGGVAGALARHADAVVAAMPGDQRAQARRILVSLVDAAGAGVMRTEAQLADGAVARAALEALVRGRLVRVHDAGDEPVHALASPGLASLWPTLREWIDSSGERRAARERVVAAAAEWERLGRAGSAVWRDRRLLEAARLPADELGPREHAFLAASRRALRRRRLARVALVAAVPLVLAGAFTASRVQAGRAVARRVELRLAEADGALADARALTSALAARRAAAFALFDRGDRDAGEAAWTQVLGEAAAADEAWARAAQLAETALLIDAQRAPARAALADALYGRALLAEASQRTDDVAELRARLALYDEGGARARAWLAPAQLQVDSSPSGAALVVERFVEDDAGARFEPVPAQARTPAHLELAPGSYRLRLTAEGHSETRLPLLLARGARHQVAVPLPAAEAVPPGWIHVPAGRFLIGAAVDETQRRDFFLAVPLHETATAAYLIQRDEVTWAEWITYLETLPAAEREARSPHVGAVGELGAVHLRREDGAWTLLLQPGTVLLRARAGEPLVYPGRDRRAAVSWLRLPVSGISAGDAHAYAAYLGARLGLHARLCTEAEWERAARGADGRPFPHGQRVRPDDVNHEATYGRRPEAMGPDEVGSHPASRSPFGLEDMAGNVFELVAGPGEGQWARGGAYAYDILASRSEMRERSDAGIRDATAGFRLCADLPGGAIPDPGSASPPSQPHPGM